MKNKRMYITRLVYSILTTGFLIYFFSKTINGRIIFIPFLICGFSQVIKNILMVLNKKDYAKIFDKVFVLGFLLFWFGFLIYWCFTSVRDKNYTLLLPTIPFWIVSIYIIKKKLFRTNKEVEGKDSEKEIEYGHPIYLISDEPYRELVYDDVKIPFVTNYYNNTIICYSFSKSLSLPGERIGYVIVNPTCIDAQKVYKAIAGAARSLGYVCAPSLFQYMIPKCLGYTSDLKIYKENIKYNPKQEQKEIEEKLYWLKDMVNMTEENYTDDAKQYVNSLTKDIFEANVYVMSPKGRVIDLPNGSTPIDFAYKIHTQVGHTMVGAVVNGTMVPLSYVLKTGDVVDIKTNKNTGPSEDWLNIAKTTSALNHIRKYLSKQNVYQTEFGSKGRGLTELQKSAIDDLNLPGIDFIETQKRYYPYGDFLSYTLGYAIEKTYIDESGNEVSALVGEMGIEKQYNDILN